MENRTIYQPKILDDIWNSLSDPDPGRGGRMTMTDMARIGSAIEQRPYGQAMMAWEHPAEKEDHLRENHIEISWYRLRKNTYIVWNTESTLRFYGPHIAKHEHFATVTATYIRSEAWKSVFSERYRMCCNLVARRKMARENVYPPEDLIVSGVVDFFCGIFLIETFETGRYLCSPINCVPVKNSRLGVGDALKIMGIEIPEDTKDQVWGKIKYWWALASLAV